MLERASHLTVAKRQLIALMSQVGFGRLEGFRVKNGEPQLDPPPRLVFELAIHEEPKTASRAPSGDFILKEEVTRLFQLFTRLRNARIERLEVRGGLPHRIHLEQEPGS